MQGKFYILKYSPSPTNPVQFPPYTDGSFYDIVKQRVGNYFASRNLSPYANNKMRLKTIAMFSIYFVPYIVMLFGVITNPWAFIGIWVVMGIGMVGIGTSIMHDSNHNAYSRHLLVNSLLGKAINLVGGYATNWKLQHNVLHHDYTNLTGLDEDIHAGNMLRLCPHKPQRKIYRFQHWYAWGLYSLMTVFWITLKDFAQLARYRKNGLLKQQNVSYSREVLHLIAYRVFYYAYALVLPLMLSGMSWGIVLTGFILMHLIAGLSLASILQPAHVIEAAEYPAVKDKQMEKCWAVHQLLNTANFAPNNRPLSWFVGGLNYQIEHHLFPNVCHIHYPQLSKIVKSTADEFGLPYKVAPTFREAILEHARMLKYLGRTAPIAR